MLVLDIGCHRKGRWQSRAGPTPPPLVCGEIEQIWSVSHGLWNGMENDCCLCYFGMETFIELNSKRIEVYVVLVLVL